MINLLYGSREELKRCLKDPERRILFHPDLQDLRVGETADIQIAFGDSAVRFPMRALVSARRVAQKGTVMPQGLYYEVIPEDAGRFRRLYGFAYDTWRPRVGRQRRYPVTLSLSYQTSTGTHQAETRDISAQGLFVRTDQPLPEAGQEIKVRLKPSWFSWAVSLHVRVCWIDPVETRRGMGLCCLNAEGLKRLESLVRKLQSKTRVSRAA